MKGPPMRAFLFLHEGIGLGARNVMSYCLNAPVYSGLATSGCFSLHA